MRVGICKKCGTTATNMARGLCKKCYAALRRENFRKQGTKFCECGCGTEIPKLTGDGKQMRFYPGHNFKREVKIKKICPVCKAEFEVYPSDSPRMICCSIRCSAINRRIPEKKLDSKGYVVYPGYTIGGTKREHRKIMEDILGRKLKRNEYVHHIDGNKENNSPENLKVVSAGDHFRYHLKVSGYRKGISDDVLQL